MSAADGETDTGGEFTPVVKLAIIAVSDGEEHEDVVYRQKALLLRFDGDTKEWKERGKGDVRLLQHKETKKIRIILRQQKTLKIRMNHIVNTATELKANPGSDRAWTWGATDYSEEVAKVESFAIRFRDSEVANDFKAKYDQARKINGGDKTIVMPIVAPEVEVEEAPAKKADTDSSDATPAAAAAAPTTAAAPSTAAATPTPASPAK